MERRKRENILITHQVIEIESSWMVEKLFVIDSEDWHFVEFNQLSWILCHHSILHSVCAYNDRANTHCPTSTSHHRSLGTIVNVLRCRELNSFAFSLAYLHYGWANKKFEDNKWIVRTLRMLSLLLLCIILDHKFNFYQDMKKSYLISRFISHHHHYIHCMLKKTRFD